MNESSITPAVVKVIRSAYGLSAAEFSRMIDIPQSTFTGWESGLTSTTRTRRIRAAVLGAINEDVIIGAIAISLNANTAER